MPYRRRYGRRRPRRRRNTRRRSKSRRHTTGFKTSSRFKAKTARGRKAVRRAGKIACPVVYECLKKIADHNIVWNLKDCEGLMETTVLDFTTSIAFTARQGPFSLGTGEAIDRCGYLGLNIYKNPVTVPSCGLMTTDMHPASSTYGRIPLDFHVFPLLAQTNPAAAAVFNGSNCRDSSKCMVNYFDNRHSLTIKWPPVDATAVGTYLFTKRQKLIMHEVLYWIPDIATIVTHSLVVPIADVGTVALAQVELRKQRSWLRQMYNAKFCTHPLADSVLAIGGTGADIVDIVTGPPVNAFDTFQETRGPTVRIQNNNIKPRFKDTKQFLAAGILDRRKDARVVWQRKRTYRRPTLKMGYIGTNRDTNASTVQVSLPRDETLVNAGKKFNIDKPMEWEHTLVVDGDVADDVREVCPRGVYCYVKYWFYDPGLIDSSTAAAILTPDIEAAFTTKVDKTMVLKWQNI